LHIPRPHFSARILGVINHHEQDYHNAVLMRTKNCDISNRPTSAVYGRSTLENPEGQSQPKHMQLCKLCKDTNASASV
jgi:hypothetical protein